MAGEEIRRTAEVRIRKISIGKQHAKSACISERSEAFSLCCPREIFPERLRCDLIFWLLFDQAKSSIHYNKRKQNENENGKENEYKQISPPTRATREKGGWSVQLNLIFWLLFDQAKSSINYNRKKNENENGKENEYKQISSPTRATREKGGCSAQCD